MRTALACLLMTTACGSATDPGAVWGEPDKIYVSDGIIPVGPVHARVDFPAGATSFTYKCDNTRALAYTVLEQTRAGVRATDDIAPCGIATQHSIAPGASWVAVFNPGGQDETGYLFVWGIP